MILKSFDGKEIFVREWTDVKEPKAVVQIVHGMTEHSERYDAFAKFLNERGYIVVADDHRGHGYTDGDTLGYCAGNMFFDTERDEAMLTDFYKKTFPGLKYFIFGFSYGSFVTQRYLADFGQKVKGEKRAAKLIEKLSFGAYSKKFEDGQWLSNDPENNERYAGDPLSGFTCSNRFYRDFFKGLRSLYTKRYIAGLPKDLPLLLASGEKDPVGDMGEGVKKLYKFYTEKAGMQNVSIVLFENGRHEFLNEREDREKKWGTLLNFFEENAL